MAGIRVKLQFQDAEKYWIFIDYGHMKSIQDVVNSINEKFGVSCEKLVLDDAQLPWNESVSLIKETDVLSVQLKLRKKKRKVDDSISENEPIKLVETTEAQHSIKKKIISKENSHAQNLNELLDSQFVVAKQKKKKKDSKELPQLEEVPKINKLIHLEDASRKITASSTSCCEPVNINGGELNYLEERQELLLVENNCTNLDNSQTLDKNQTLDSSKNETNEDEKAKKRRRRRKRKSHHKDEKTTTITEAPVPIDYAPPHLANRLHIRFDGSEEMEVDTRKLVDKADQPSTTAEVQTFKPPVELFPDREFNPFSKEVSNLQNSSLAKSTQAVPLKPKLPEKISTPKSNCHQPDNSPKTSHFEALLSLRSAVFTRNAKTPTNPTSLSYNKVPPPPPILASHSLDNKPSHTVEDSCIVADTSTEQVDFTKFPLFKGPPRVNDVLAFKILELSDNYNPEISEYIRGRITAIQANGEVALELLEPRAKRHTFGKFELYQNEDEEAGEAEEIEMETSMCCQWNQLIEPRLIYP